MNNSHAPKAPLLKSDPTYKNGPSTQGKYRTDASFFIYMQTYQLQHGYHVAPKHQSPTGTTLTCTTPECTWTVVSQRTTFTSGAAAGQTGFGILSTPFNPVHNHLAPYFPIDIEEENLRRTHLFANDPSLLLPPTLRPVSPMDTFLNSIHPGLTTPKNRQAISTLGINSEKDLELILELDDGDLNGLVSSIEGADEFVSSFLLEGIKKLRERRRMNEVGYDASLVRGKEKLDMLEAVQRIITTGRMPGAP